MAGLSMLLSLSDHAETPQSPKPCVLRLHDIVGWSWLRDRAYAVTDCGVLFVRAFSFPILLMGAMWAGTQLREHHGLAIRFEI